MFTIYWMWIFLLIALSFTDNKQYNLIIKKNVIFIISLILILFVGLRYKSTDYMTYSVIYDVLSFNLFNFPFYSSNHSGIEFLFATFLSFFKYLNFPFYLFILTIAILSLSLKLFYIYKYSPYFILSILLFFAFSVHKDMGQIRAALTAGIILCAVIPMINRKLIHYMIIVFIAAGFHIFSLIAIPLYFLYPYLKNINYIKILLFLAILLFFNGGLTHYVYPFTEYFGSTVYDKITLYINHPVYGQSITLNFNNIFLISFALILIFLKDNVFKEDSFYKGIFIYYIYSMIIYLIFSDLATISARMIDFMAYIPLVILIPYIIHTIKDNKLRVTVYLFAVVFAIIRFIPTAQHMEIYQNILFVN